MDTNEIREGLGPVAYLQEHPQFGKELAFAYPADRLTIADKKVGWSERSLYSEDYFRDLLSELDRLRSSNEEMRKALEWIADGVVHDAELQSLYMLDAKATIIDRLKSKARAALSTLKEEDAK